jgi:hypothetical protein
MRPMDKRALLYVTALLAVGGTIGFFWRKVEREPATDLTAASAESAGTLHAGTPAAPTSAQMLENQLQATLGSGDHQPRPASAAVPGSWGDPLQRAEARRQLEQWHPDLATALQLEPDKAGQFLDLLARQQLDIADLIAARSGDIRDGVYSQRLLREIEVMELSDNSEQAALLGDKYPDWLQHQQNEVLSNPVDQLHGMLVRQGIGTPEADFEPLATALAAEQSRFSKELARPSEPGSSPRELLQEQLQYAANNRQLVRVASRFLNAEQLAAYEQLLERRRLTTQRLLRTMRDGAGD